MAKAAYDLPADVSFQDAACRVLITSFRMMQENTAGTKAGTVHREPTPEEIEALHDMRVGSRRLRAALSVFGSLFPRDEFRTMERQVGDITDALGAVRDLDVHLDVLRRLQEKLPENEAYGIGRLIARQTKQRDKERKKLLQTLERLEKERFERRFMKALQRALPSVRGDECDDAKKDSKDRAKEAE